MIKKQFIFYTLIVLSFFCSCGNDEETEIIQEMSYYQLINSLITEDTNLSSISNSTNIPKSDLVKIKYGIIAENEELTDFLRDLKIAYFKNDEDEIDNLLHKKQKIEIDKTIIGRPISISSFRDQEYKNNEAFQRLLPIIGQKAYNIQIEKYINEKYSIIGIPINLWNYVVNSKEEYLKLFKNELQDNLTAIDLNKTVQNRIDAYVEMLVTEHEVLYGKKIKTDKIQIESALSNLNVELDKDTKDKLIEHAVLDLYDLGINVAEETVVALIIWGIIYFIIKYYIRKKVKSELKNFKIKEGAGFWNNALRFAIAAVVDYGSQEQQKQEIREKWENRRFWINVIVGIIITVGGYNYLTKPAAEIEVQVEQNIKAQIKDYFGSIDIWILSELNKITSEI